MATDTTQTNKRSTFDQFVLFLAIFESLTTLPQLYQVWIKGQTAGVSVITWLGYSIVEGIWLTYGIKQRDKAIIAGSLSWGLMELLVAIGALVK